ncbi:MAG TPA: transporter substrate-binding domain-containing protein [Alphaproteobacteria bacterium]|nr:transporter substrate-binding domain-containing protein [Alphaproteobacteria bacterium]
MKTHNLAAALASAIAAGVILHHGSASADALDAIKARGTLVVGTKADYRPFGLRDASGAIVGFEPDLAKDIANRLGVKLELVPVVATNRISLLTEGKLDLVIATMNITPERRKLVDFIEPAYYASGVNALAPKSQHLHVWQQLRGRPVCMIEGAFYNAEIKQRYDPVIVSFKSTNEVYSALKGGTCVAVAYDDTAIIGQLQNPEWQDYEMPFSSILVEPWGMAVRLGETRFEELLSNLIKEWHRTGRVQELEKTWHIPASAFADEMHRRYLENQ